MSYAITSDMHKIHCDNCRRSVDTSKSYWSEYGKIFCSNRCTITFIPRDEGPKKPRIESPPPKDLRKAAVERLVLVPDAKTAPRIFALKLDAIIDATPGLNKQAVRAAFARILDENPKYVEEFAKAARGTNQTEKQLVTLAIEQLRKEWPSPLFTYYQEAIKRFEAAKHVPRKRWYGGKVYK